MKKITILLFISFIACNNSKPLKIYQGEVYIKLVDVGSLYGAPKNVIEKIKNSSKDSIYDKKHKDTNAKYFENLINYGLIDRPYFKLKFSKDEIVNVFTNEINYKKVNPIIDSLNRDTEKIIIKFKGVKKDKSIYYTEDIISINKVSGKTDWEK
ncbi:hypothetical protein C8N26_0391 [Tenacibaculum lutimaris]|uniref:Lipoprotein n=1 Tax=Tenacibaculum lutimaris TaxID=285258 RepID=A0A420E494_9FLAO|nr:hypothetical protein [Tenacibaculum lutimaris]RKF04994.1 hypothetical protein C8N26_0391 [Tenacibaculum lutimaris]